VLTAILERPELQRGVAYQLLDLLGRGSHGSVWEAENSDGDIVAMKFLVSDDGLTTSNILWSLQALRQLGHPHLVHIEGFWSYYGHIVVAMERADGTLLDLLKRSRSRHGRPLPAEQVCAYLTQAAEAIDYLNGRKLGEDGRHPAFQHCAVRPSNLLLFGDTVKLADAGPVMPVNIPLKFRHWAGRLDYAAPEVFRGRLSDWTDQYALAVTYCELRGGRMPFADTPQTLTRSYVRPEPNLAMLSLMEQAILTRALAPVPQDRWPSCGEMMIQLARAVGA